MIMNNMSNLNIYNKSTRYTTSKDINPYTGKPTIVFGKPAKLTSIFLL